MFLSQIEGTQSSLSDLMAAEAGAGMPIGDVVPTSDHVAALDRGMTMIRAGAPISDRLFWNMHEALMEGDRSGAAPGPYRRPQNWIGAKPSEAAHVPPPVHRAADCMAALERGS